MQIIRKYKWFYLLNSFSIYILPLLFLIISGSYFDFLIVSATFLVPFGCLILGTVFGFLCKTAGDIPRYAITVSLLIFPAVFVPSLTGDSFSEKLLTFMLLYICYFVLTIFAGLLGQVLRALFLKSVQENKTFT